MVFKKILPKRARLFLREPYLKLRNRFKYGSSDFFSTVDFETITTCNRRCSYCPNSIYERGLAKNKKLMNENIFKKIVKELAEINFSGQIRPVFYGEPILDDRLESWIAYLKENLPRSEIVVFTNGDFLTFDLYKKFTTAGADFFVISNHDGGNMPNTHRIFLDNFKKINYSGEGYVGEAAYSLDGKNIAIVYRNPSKMNLYNRGGLMKKINNLKFKPICRLPSENLTIDWQGNVILCCNDYLSSIKLGNLREKTILQTWSNPVFSKIRKDLKKGILNLEICKTCKKTT